jgi:prepilin-type N-terminal cleavage/methylation domain-containing protein
MINNSSVPLLRKPAYSKKGFTLIEIVTVVTIIVILMGILVPAILSIQKKAKIARSEVLFSRLINSLILYKKDYGFYPDVSGTESGGDVVIDLNNSDQWKRFAEVLALSLPDGSAIENPEDNIELKQSNPKLKRYFGFRLSELEKVGGSDQLVDAFGNPHIFIVVDADLDNRIRKESLPGSEKRDLRQRIVVYTSDEGNDDFPELRTWDS